MALLPFYLAHGAGAGHNHIFLQKLHQALLQQKKFNITPVTFAYMADQIRSGKKKPPPRINHLIEEYEEIIAGEESCIVAGKSMGGRVATQLTKLPEVKAVVCYGFPFYPARKPEKHRLSFLEELNAPCLIIQGTRDALGSYQWVSQQSLPENITMVWIEGADHDFKTLKKYNKSIDDTIAELAIQTSNWVKNLKL